MTGDWDKFRDLLNAQYQWPTPYRFKFVVPMTSLPRLESALDGKKLDFKPSKTQVHECDLHRSNGLRR